VTPFATPVGSVGSRHSHKYGPQRVAQLVSLHFLFPSASLPATSTFEVADTPTKAEFVVMFSGMVAQHGFSSL
jgi:hypothetical protein